MRKIALALPLSIIINKSLNSGIFPTAWKEALIIPLFKGGDSSSVTNYRPISILNVFAKIFESLVCPALSWRLKQFIIPEQHGFVRARSTVTNLTSFVGDLTDSIDIGHSIDTIYTDFSKAFDKVSHHILLEKLHYLGINGIFLSWLKSYLTNRKSVVCLSLPRFLFSLAFLRVRILDLCYLITLLMT